MTVLDVIDTGIWTVGFATVLAVPNYVARTEGVEAAAVAVALMVGAVLLLGITGERAVESIDALTGRSA